MAVPAVGNLVHETSATTGTGDLTTSAVNGKQRGDAVFGTSDLTTGNPWVFISNRDAAEWEIRQTYWSATGTVKRTGAPTYSSNANAAVSFSAGTKDVTSDIPAELQILGGWSTGDVKATMKTTADAGWVMMDDGNIGDASSSATTRANADTSALFTLLWTNTVDANCAVSTGRGASAAADFAAHKTIALPKTRGRALGGSGAGSALTSRALAATVGLETHTLTTPEIPSHSHSYTAPALAGIANSGGDFAVSSSGGAGSTTGTAGGGGSHNNMQPTTFINWMLKL